MTRQQEAPRIRAAHLLRRNWGWEAAGACTTGPDPIGWLDKPTAEQVADCRSCPVQLLCLAHAMVTGATNVVQGGVRIGNSPLREANLVLALDLAEDLVEGSKR